ncbi:MipA/OmpV family protein [Acerihabitans sp. KWT182]|uniref:MipA/OmpV family protein n=1 Tax=Acerihabitans sp. KWT182 TaxID=3157919 RepID=A0AAU7Q7V6_9GAMM
MTTFLCRRSRLPLLAASLMLYSGALWADGGKAPEDGGDGGFTLSSDVADVTHWGLGAGLAYHQSPYRGYGADFSPLPLLYFEDKWVRFLGTTLDAKVGKWDDVAITLRGTYAFGDGYTGSDAPILNGMEKRNAAFWFGPAVAWTTGFGTLSAEFLTSDDKGQKAGLDFGKSFVFNKFSIEPYIGAHWLSDKYVDYYYGVMSSEARPGRDQYSGQSTYQLSAGARFGYRFTAHQSLSLDMGVTRLGSGITDSPLVDKTTLPMARFGYLYTFE